MGGEDFVDSRNTWKYSNLVKDLVMTTTKEKIHGLSCIFLKKTKQKIPTKQINKKEATKHKVLFPWTLIKDGRSPTFQEESFFVHVSI